MFNSPIKRTFGPEYAQIMFANQTYPYISRTGASFLKHNSEDSISQTFQEMKEQKYKEMLNRYKSNYLLRIKGLNLDGQEFLDTVLQGDLSNEIIASAEKAFQKNIVEIEHNIQASNFTDLLNKVRKSSNFLMKKGHGVAVNLNKLNTFLGHISEAATLFSGNEANELSVILKTYTKTSTKLKHLNNFIESKTASKKVSKAQRKVLQKVAKDLASLLTRVEAKDVGLTPAAISTHINNIMNTDLGEAINAQIIGLSLKKLPLEMNRILSGTKGFKGIAGEEVDYLKKTNMIMNSTYKPDAIVKDANVELKMKSTESNISIDLGFSTKWYREGAKVSGTVDIVSDKPSQQVFLKLFNSLRLKYITSNILANVGDLQSLYFKMKAVIVAAYADNFISGTGLRQDFSQYLIINGKAYSIYEILKLVKTHNEGISEGFGKHSDIVQTSIAGLRPIGAKQQEIATRIEENSMVEAWRRNKVIHGLLLGRDLKITGRFYPDNFSKLVGKA